MERAGLGFGDLGAIAVGVGPGGFTGLRIGIVDGAGAGPAPPGSSCARCPRWRRWPPARSEGLALALIDAKRGELFAALYEDGEELWEPFAATPGDLAERVRGAGLDPLAVGDGSVRFREELEASGIRVAPAESGSHVVSALQVCRLAAGAPGVAPEAVLPHYLRAPDAKPR